MSENLVVVLRTWPRVDRTCDNDCHGAGEAQGDGRGRRSPLAIYIGNSFFYYNNSLHNHVTQLIRAADPTHPFRSTSVTISGSGSDWHDVGSYFRPNAIGRYSFDGENNIVFNSINRLFDLAIMMDCSQCPVHPQLRPIFFEQMKLHADTVRKHDTKPVFFMSWAYSDLPAMTMQLADAYTPPETITMPSLSRQVSLLLRRGGNGRNSISTSPTSDIPVSPAPISPPQPLTARCSESRRSG